MRRLFALLAIVALLIAPLGMIGGAAMAHEPPKTEACHDSAAEQHAAPTKGGDQGLPGMSSHCAVTCAMIPPTVPLLAPMPSCVDAVPVNRPLVELSGLTPTHEPPPPR